MPGPMDPASYYDGDLETSLFQMRRILETGIFSSQGTSSPFFEAVVTKFLIELNDALQKAALQGKRVAFSDDVQPTAKRKDVTDLIASCRNAACHVSSGSKLFENNKFSFMVLVGRHPNAVSINGVTLGSDYDDDIAVYWGNMRLYLGRHVVRAYKELTSAFPPRY